jgi:hypothetical protein
MKMTKFLMGSAALTLAMGSVAQAGEWAKWHMEAITPNVLAYDAWIAGPFLQDAILDDDAAAPGRDRDLFMGLYPGFPNVFVPATKPTLTTGGGGVVGEALVFDGIDDEALSAFTRVSTGSNGHWPGTLDLTTRDEVTLDMYFLEDDQVGHQVLLEARSTWSLALKDDELSWNVWLEAGGASEIKLPLDAAGAWRHVTASFDSAGNQSLTVDGLGTVTATSSGMLLQSHEIGVGNKWSQDRWFGGMMDEVIIYDSVPLVSLDGDLDGDGFVGIADLNIVLGDWNNFVPPADPAADPSGDNFVGIADLNVVLGNWNAGTPPAGAAVPEPASLALLGLGGAMLMGRRRS